MFMGARTGARTRIFGTRNRLPLGSRNVALERAVASLRSTIKDAERAHDAEVSKLREELGEARGLALQLQRELERARTAIEDAQSQLRNAHASRRSSGFTGADDGR